MRSLFLYRASAIIVIFALTQILFVLINPFEFYSIRLSTIFYYFSYFLLIAFVLPFFPVKFDQRLISADVSHHRLRASNLSWFYSIPTFLVFCVAMVFIISNEISLQFLRDSIFFGDGTFLPFVYGDIFLFLLLYFGVGYYLLISYLVRYKLLGSISDRNSSIVVATAIFFLDSATGGRMAAAYIVLFIFIVSTLTGGRSVQIFAGHLTKFVVVICTVIFTIFVFARLESGSSIFKFLYLYLVAPVFMLEQGITDPYGLIGSRFGMSAMSLDWVFVGLLKYFGLDLRTLADLSNGNISTGYYLSNNDGTNAYFSAPFYFYLDYGFFGGVFMVFYNLLPYLLVRILLGLQTQICFLVLIIFGTLIGIRENIFNSPTFLISAILLIFFPFSIVVKK
jgi:hypothetical protein